MKNRKTPLVIDLVLDGGIFNGSYLIGALYFLKEMEKKKYIKINELHHIWMKLFLYLLILKE
mgnify:CR=1 FL=1